MLAIVATIGADIFDSLVALGFDAGKSGIKKKYDQHKLKTALKEYIEANSEIREADSLDEEIDYQGLVDYIKDNFLEEVSTRIFDVKERNRGEARSNIVTQAIAYCKAGVEPAKKRVADFVCGCLDIYKNFFKKDIPAEVYIVAGEVTDAVNAHIDETKVELSEQIGEVQNAALYSLDAIDKDAKKGDFGSIGKKIASQLSVASSHHPLFPYYGFDYQNGKLVSKPAIPEASKKYPERYELKGKGHIDGHIFKTWPEMASFAYRHQTPITVNVESLKKFLGDVEDPAPQPDINDIKDRTVYAYPPKFPPAFPCSVKVDNETFFDYVLLRTQEIQDDGTYVISNKEQKDSPLFVELKLRRIDQEHATGTTNFRFDFNNAKHKDYLQYARFMKAAAGNAEISIHVLEHNADLLRGKVGNVHYNMGFKDVDEEIDFLERLIDIDEYLGKEVKIPEQFTNGEYRTFVMVSDLIRGKEVTGTWNKTTLNGVVDQHFRDSLKEMGPGPHRLSVVGTKIVKVFGEEIVLRCLQDLKEVYFEDFDKMLKLADLLDDGDSIKIKLMPGKDRGYMETTNIPEQLQEEAVE